MRGPVVILLVLVGCVRTGTTTCDDGSVCREGTTCHAVGPGAFECVTPEQFAACEGISDGMRCEPDGTCFGGACLPSVCGNNRVDVGEACDDGNTDPDDTCSEDCRSDGSCGNRVLDTGELCDDGNAMGNDGCTSTCAPEFARWDLRRSRPSARSNVAMVSEPAGRRIVMFGGFNVGLGDVEVYLNDTWELGRDGWVRIPSLFSPSPRGRHAMAHDGQQTVLFGGAVGETVLGETWTLVGRTWRRSMGTEPKPRRDHAMAFLPGTGIVLFGGFAAKDLDDTWVFANGAWTEVAIPPDDRPPPRQRHALAYDETRQVLVMSGGANDRNGVHADTWEFDGATWVLRNDTGPRLASAAVAFDRERGQLVMHGGVGFVPERSAIPQPDGETRGETYAWDGTTWVSLGGTQPVLSASAVANDPETGEPLLFGGRFDFTTSCPLVGCVDVFADLWKWSDDTWSTIPYVDLPPIESTPASFDIERRTLVAFLGGTTYEMRDGSWLVRTPMTSPPARTNAAMAYGPYEGELASILFGGETTSGTVDDMWTFDGVIWKAHVGSRPAPRSGHAMVFDRRRDRVVLFGGGSPLRDDHWEWDGMQWIELAPALRPSPREHHAMAYDPIRERVLLFGGEDGSGSLGDFWSWDGTTWTQIQTPISPPPRRGGLAWDAARQRMILSGGDGDDTWEWDGTAWSFLGMFDPPPARRGPTLVPAPGGTGVLALGGLLGGNIAGEPAQFRFESAADYAACRSQLDDDGDGLAGCADPDCWTVCTPWCPPGAPCDATASRCGDGTCSPPRESCGICPEDCMCP